MFTVISKDGTEIAYDKVGRGPAVIVGEDRIVPNERVALITAPTLIMEGSASAETMPFMHATANALTKAMPNARHQVLEGRGHDLDPNVLAPVLAEFFGYNEH